MDEGRRRSRPRLSLSPRPLLSEIDRSFLPGARAPDPWFASSVRAYQDDGTAGMDWTVDPSADVPPSRQLVEILLDALASGRLRPGDRLPSVRRLAGQAMVNHNTVARAWRDLDGLGVVEGQNGRGVFVTPEGPRIARERRRASTLANLRRALAEALRAGHDLVDLIRLLEEEQRRSA